MLAYTLLTTSVALSAHASGIFTLSYFDRDDDENTNEPVAALDSSTAGFFTFAPEVFDASIALNDTPPPRQERFAENEALYEEIYLSQLYEELQLMNDYDELLTALSIQESKNQQQAIQAQLEQDHDYHELMGAYSYHLEYDRLIDHLANVQFHSDYDELMDALAAVDLDSKSFDIRFSDSTYIDEDNSTEAAGIDFAKLTPEQQASLQEQMEHGELAAVDRAIRRFSTN